MMNSLSSLSPPLLALSGAGSARADAAWLDQATQNESQALHVSPHSRPRAIDDIERDFLQALCVTTDTNTVR